MSHGVDDHGGGPSNGGYQTYLKWGVNLLVILLGIILVAVLFHGCPGCNSNKDTASDKDKLTWVPVWRGKTPHSQEFEGYFQYDSFGPIYIHTVDRNNPKGPKNVTPYSGQGAKQTLPERGYGPVYFTSQGDTEVEIILYEPKYL